MKEVQFTLDYSDIDHLCRKTYLISQEDLVFNPRYEWVKGDQLEALQSINEKYISVFVVGESFLEASAFLQIMQNEGYLAGLFWDTAPINEDENAPYWGFSIFSYMR